MNIEPVFECRRRESASEASRWASEVSPRPKLGADFDHALAPSALAGSRLRRSRSSIIIYSRFPRIESLLAGYLGGERETLGTRLLSARYCMNNARRNQRSIIVRMKGWDDPYLGLLFYGQQ